MLNYIKYNKSLITLDCLIDIFCSATTIFLASSRLLYEFSPRVPGGTQLSSRNESRTIRKSLLPCQLVTIVININISYIISHFYKHDKYLFCLGIHDSGPGCLRGTEKYFENPY